MRLALLILAGLLVAAPALAWENPDGPVRTVWLEAIGLKSYDARAEVRTTGPRQTVNDSSVGGRLGFVAGPSLTLTFLASYDRTRVGDVQGKFFNAGVALRFYLVRPER